jgi:hypothetical protein
MTADLLERETVPPGPDSTGVHMTTYDHAEEYLGNTPNPSERTVEDGEDQEAPSDSVVVRALELFGAIEGIPTPYTARYLATHHEVSAGEATDLLADVKRFLALRVAADEAIVPNKVIDEAWHALILQTIEYRRVCRGLGRFVDHTTETAPVTKAGVRCKELFPVVFNAEMYGGDGETDCDSPEPGPIDFDDHYQVGPDGDGRRCETESGVSWS